ncbi:hypothetical protein [Xanthomonas phage JUN5]|nr:hypothetical protein [Xanthomonas phage JUN5]
MNQVNVELGARGLYRLDVFKADAEGNKIGDPVKSTGWFDNLILNAGLAYWADPGDTFTSCQVGSGSTAPANTDTSLQTRIAGTSTVVSTTENVQGTAPYYAFLRRIYEFGTGAAAGNLSEVGVGWGATGATLFSRALIVDGGGTPTTITVLADEILQVTYEIRLYMPTGDVTGSFVSNAVTYNYTLRAANVTSTAPWSLRYSPTFNLNRQFFYAGAATLGAITSAPTGTSAPASSASADTSPTGPTFNATMAAALATANLVGGVGAVYFASSASSGESGGAWQMGFSPALPKDATKTLSVTISVTYGRYTP